MQTQSLRRDSMGKRNIFRIHPSFRIIALAIPPTRENPWCTSELLAMFPFVDVMASLTLEEKLKIMTHRLPLQEAISPLKQQSGEKLISLFSSTYAELERMENNSSNEIKLSASLSQTSFVPSSRQLLRLWKGCCEAINSIDEIEASEDLILQNIQERIHRMFMVPFMPQTLRETFDTSLARIKSSEISENTPRSPRLEETSTMTPRENQSSDLPMVRIGNVSLPLNIPERPELVPNTLFIEIPAHIKYLESIAHDILAGERHILLIGNQGEDISIGRSQTTPQGLGRIS
jgi:von Willebrand factor A domain-containing protein 8